MYKRNSSLNRKPGQQMWTPGKPYDPSLPILSDKSIAQDKLLSWNGIYTWGDSYQGSLETFQKLEHI